MRAFILSSVLIFFVLSCLGCSTSMPLSETYMFTAHKVIAEDLYSEKDSLNWKSTKGGAFSFNTQSPEIKNYLNKNYDTKSYPDLNKLGIAFSSASNEGSFAWGYDIGYKALGLNATWGLGWNNYLTLNAGMPSGGELILQHKIFQHSANRAPGGIAIGAFIRRDYYGYYKPSDSITGIYNIPELAPIDSFGGRGMFHFRFFYEAMVHGVVSYGYSPQLDTGILNIGIVVGADLFK